jgi:hypothetical protein
MVNRERWLAVVALSASLLIAPLAAAETITYRVDIEAPDNLAAVLRTSKRPTIWPPCCGTILTL